MNKLRKWRMSAKAVWDVSDGQLYKPRIVSSSTFIRLHRHSTLYADRRQTSITTTRRDEVSASGWTRRRNPGRASGKAPPTEIVSATAAADSVATASERRDTDVPLTADSSNWSRRIGKSFSCHLQLTAVSVAARCKQLTTPRVWMFCLKFSVCLNLVVFIDLCKHCSQRDNPHFCRRCNIG